jgi:hypothetical protein
MRVDRGKGLAQKTVVNVSQSLASILFQLQNKFVLDSKKKEVPCCKKSARIHLARNERGIFHERSSANEIREGDIKRVPTVHTRASATSYGALIGSVARPGHYPDQIWLVTFFRGKFTGNPRGKIADAMGFPVR